MMISVDPAELGVVSAVLASGAAEAADIGVQLGGCLMCPMPAVVRTAVDQMVATIDRALDASAAQLSTSASELSLRAQLAAYDISLAATIGVAGTAPTSSTPVGAAVVESMSAGSGVAGATVTPNVTTASAPLDVAASTTRDPVLRLMEIAQAKHDSAVAGLEAIFNDPTVDPHLQTAALSALSGADDGIDHGLAPSRSDLDRQYGYHLSNGQVEAISPDSLDWFDRPRP